MIDLRKIGIIIRREYLTRLRSKAFILTTLLLPIGGLLIFAIPIIIQFMESDTRYEFAVIDETGVVYRELAAIDSTRYRDRSDSEIPELRELVMNGDLDGYIRIHEEHLTGNRELEMIHGGSGGLELVSSLRSQLRSAIREVQLDRAEVPEDIRGLLDRQPDLSTRTLTEEGEEEESNTMFLYFLGFGMAFVMYFAMFGYGGLVMRSVIEEKTSRIVEIIASSVKPFELLLGKILGVGALGFTQFLVWVAAGAGMLTFGAPLALSMMNGGSGESSTAAMEGSGVSIPEIPTVEPMIWFYFVLFFLLGYFIYSALFAAVGSAVESETDTQQLMMPLMIPIIVAILLLPQVASAPDSTLAVIGSLIPFLSPVLMIARIPITDVPLWELLLCIGLMLGTIAGVLSLGAKIYRVGILKTGKRATFGEMMKWIRS